MKSCYDQRRLSSSEINNNSVINRTLMSTVVPLRRPRPYTGFTHGGFVRFDEQIYPCDVTDMTSTGATLSFRMIVELPERFILQLTADGRVSRHCTVTWEEGTKTGVVFDDRHPSAGC
jgi:hypothetical protein